MTKLKMSLHVLFDRKLSVQCPIEKKSYYHLSLYFREKTMNKNGFAQILILVIEKKISTSFHLTLVVN